MQAVKKGDEIRPSQRGPRIGQLRRVDDILREARRVYRMARAGEIGTADMSRYVVALHTMVSILRNNALEERLAALEATLGGTNERL